MTDLPSYYDADEEISELERSRREKCTSKVTYSSPELARAAALQAEWATGQKTAALLEYRCRYCALWHLSASRSSHVE